MERGRINHFGTGSEVKADNSGGCAWIVCGRPPESFPIDKEKSMSSGEIHENFFLRFIEKIETSRKKRDLSGVWDIVFKMIAVSYSLFLIYTAVSGV